EASAGAERGEAALRIHHVGRSPAGCRLQAEIELGGVERAGDAAPCRLGFALVAHEVADQRVLDRKHRVAAEIRVGAVEDMRRHRSNPSAETTKWMCAGRQGWRPVAFSIAPTGPS